MLLYISTFLLFVTTIFSIAHFAYLSFHLGFVEVFHLNRCLVSLLISIAVAAWGLKRKSLDKSGAISGIFIGSIITFSNYCFTACLLVFFYTSSKLTRLHSAKKRKIEADYKVGGQRNWIQVLCNSCAATEFSLLYILHNGVGEFSVEFHEHFLRSWLSIAVLSALAGANGDTWASEVGTVLAGSEPRLITSFRKVPVGTNGGVSLAGSFVSVLGGAVVGLGYSVTLTVLNVDRTLIQAIILMSIGAFAGLFGSLVDSLIGATLQFSGKDMTTGKIVQHPGPLVKHISGRPILSNDSVNMITSFINAIVVPTVTAHICLWLL